MPPSAPRWIEYRAVSDIVPAARNPKGHDTQAITASMRRLGYTEPVLVDERTGRLISGHGRIESLAALEAKGEPPPEGVEIDGDGRWTIPVVRGWRSENDIEANMALVGANALTMAGGWSDPAQLVELLQEAAAGPGLSGSGYNLTTLDKLLSDVERAELGDHTVTPNPRKPPRTTLDLMLTVGYHRQAYEGDPAVFHGKGAIGLCEVGIRSGWVYGTNSSMACCALTDHWVMHRLHFLDNPYRDYIHDEHLAMVKEFRPKFATTRDAMSPEQCAAAGIDYYPMEQILDWAAELSEHAENVIVIPKYHEAVEQIPEEYVLGYSIPTSHGGTPLPTERFAGRRVHLLGGTPLTQFRYWQKLADEVVSIDNNSIVRTSKMGVVYGPDGSAMKLPDFQVTREVTNPLYIALTLSLGHIAYWYGKGWADEEREGAEQVDEIEAVAIPPDRPAPIDEEPAA